MNKYYESLKNLKDDHFDKVHFDKMKKEMTLEDFKYLVNKRKNAMGRISRIMIGMGLIFFMGFLLIVVLDQSVKDQEEDKLEYRSAWKLMAEDYCEQKEDVEFNTYLYRDGSIKIECEKEIYYIKP